MKKKTATISFFISIAIFMVVAILRGLYPFGKNTLFVFDMSQQYVEFFGYLKHVIAGEASWNYSFVQSLGGNSVGLFAYYLMSPYNLLLFLFGDNLALGIFIITALKMASAATTMTVLLNHRNHGYAVIPFAVSYAFMSYMIIYSSNIMWLDGVIAFPIVVLGIVKMLEEKKTSLVYIFALCYSLITNFYMGYMICIASVLIFICWQIKKANYSKQFWKDTILFAGNSILGAGIGAVLLVPFAIAMTGTKSDIGLGSLVTLERIHSIKECILKIYAGSWVTVDVLRGAPIVYCGTAMMLLAAIYFLNKKIGKRDKIAAVFLIAIFGISAISKSADLVWHVFNTPTCYPGRYAFIIAFVIICMAYETYLNIDSKTTVAGIIITIAYVGLAIINRNDEHISLVPILILSIVSLEVIIFKGLSYDKKEYVKHIAITMFTIVICIDTVFQAKTEMAYLPYDDVDEFNQYYSSTNDVIKQVKSTDDSFYRMEKTFLRGNGEKIYNDSYMFNYNGISCFSSTTKDELKSFMGKLGYRQNFLKIVYGEGSTEFVDSLLGIKYILSENEETGKKDINVNPYAIGIVTEDMPAITKTEELESDDTFEYQNELCRVLNQNQDDVLHKIDDVEKKQTCEVGITKISYSFKALYPGYVYYRVQGGVGNANIRVNGVELREYYAQNQWNIGRIYAAESGQTINIDIEVGTEQCNLDDLEFYQQDENVFKNTIKNLQNRAVTVDTKGSNSLSFDTNISENGNWILLTIPYDRNWICYVDGKETTLEKVYSGFSAITLEKGTHHVELKYPVRGFRAGMVISLVSFGILTVIVWLRIRLRNKGDDSGK